MPSAMPQFMNGLTAGLPLSTTTSARKAGPVSSIDAYSTSTTVGVSASTEVTEAIEVTEATEVAETEVTEVTVVAEAAGTVDISDVPIASPNTTWAKVPEMSTSKISEAPTSQSSDSSAGISYTRFDSYEMVSSPAKVPKVTKTTSISEAGASTVASDMSTSKFAIAMREPKPVNNSFKSLGLKHGVAGNKLVIGIDFGTTYTG